MTNKITTLITGQHFKHNVKADYKDDVKQDWKADWATEPAAALVADVTTGTHPLAVTFTNNSTGTYSTCLWDFGDGSTSTAAAPSHTYAAAGSYTVSLTVSGKGGSNTGSRANYIVVT